MILPRSKRYPASYRFFWIGLAGFAVWAATVLGFGWGIANLLPAFGFLGLCVPMVWIVCRTGIVERPNRWDAEGRDSMARVDSMEQTGTDDVNDPYYEVRATLVPSGREVVIRWFSFPPRLQDQLRGMDLLPVRYLPSTGEAVIRTELIEQVVDRVDPRADRD